MSTDLAREFQKYLHSSEHIPQLLSHQDLKEIADIALDGAQLPELQTEWGLLKSQALLLWAAKPNITWFPVPWS